MIFDKARCIARGGLFGGGGGSVGPSPEQIALMEAQQRQIEEMRQQQQMQQTQANQMAQRQQQNEKERAARGEGSYLSGMEEGEAPGRKSYLGAGM